MIIEFSVKNFKSIKEEQTISFEATNSKDLEEYLILTPELLHPKKSPLRLLKINLVYGANGSGKSNLINALDALDTAMRVKHNDKEGKNSFITPFLFDKKTPSEPTEIKISFIAPDKIIYEYELKISSDYVHDEKLYSIESGRGLLFHRTTDQDKKISHIDIKPRMQMKHKDRDSLSNSTLWNSTVISTFASLNIENTYLDSVISWLNEILMPPVEPKTSLVEYISAGINNNFINKDNLIELMREADFCVSDFFEKDHKLTKDELDFLHTIKDMNDQSAIDFKENLKNKKDLFFVHTVDSIKYNMRFEDESLGTQRYFELGGLLDFVTSKNKFIPIDEFESSLHPELIIHFLLKFMKTKHNSQMLITTHYREFLANKGLFRNDSIFFVEKDKISSSTEIYSLADFGTGTIRETSSVFNAYKSGKLGGTPDIK